MITFLQPGKHCPSVVDMVSAPLLGHNLRIIALHLGLRVSHLRQFDADSIVGHKLLVMLNPVISPEAHTSESF